MTVWKFVSVFKVCENVEAKEAVTHRSAHHRHRRTQSVLTKSPTHPARFTGALNKTTNLNLTQGKTIDVLRKSTSYFDVDWNAFASPMMKTHTGNVSSLQWVGGW
jgi:hypothetical protein